MRETSSASSCKKQIRQESNTEQNSAISQLSNDITKLLQKTKVNENADFELLVYDTTDVKQPHVKMRLRCNKTIQTEASAAKSQNLAEGQFRNNKLSKIVNSSEVENNKSGTAVRVSTPWKKWLSILLLLFTCCVGFLIIKKYSKWKI